MRLHILVEGPSEEAFLNAWLPRFLDPAHSFRIITHQGKGKLSRDPNKPFDPKHRGLLDQLPAKLRVYGRTLKADTDRVVVLVDADNQDCKDLLRRLKQVSDSCDPAPTVLFRIAIEETEAFFLGDSKALKAAFPAARTGKLRGHVFDSICGTWEKLRDVLGESSDDKVGWAEAIGQHLDTNRKGRRATNKSPSFRKLCEGLRRICGEA